MMTVTSEPVPGINAPTFTYDAVFDTNAIRTIGELPKNNFIAPPARRDDGGAADRVARRDPG